MMHLNQDAVHRVQRPTGRFLLAAAELSAAVPSTESSTFDRRPSGTVHRALSLKKMREPPPERNTGFSSVPDTVQCTASGVPADAPHPEPVGSAALSAAAAHRAVHGAAK